MLTVISPAKRLDDTPPPLPAGLEMTTPAFASDAARLARVARRLKAADLGALMHISPALADLNRARFKAFRAAPEAADLRPAALFFAGDTYQGLRAGTLDPAGLAFAQDHLRILSGLYGLLRPLDGIQAYRLEMGSRLATVRGADLYAWWGARIAKALNAQAKALRTDTLVNCASQEYFRAVDRKALKLRVVTPVFLEEKGNTAATVGFYAKNARGAMARHLAQTRATDPAALRDFTTDGYRFRADLSDDARWVFTRRAPD